MLHIFCFVSKNYLFLDLDVLGFVKSMGSLEEYRSDNETRNKLRLLLCDIE